MREDEKDYLEESFKKEVLKAMDNKLSAKQKKALMEEAKTTLDFLDKIDEVELPKDNYVVFTDGKEQLLYENGEFYVISTTDSTRIKKKKTKKEATDMYLDFFIKYQLNPILDSKKGVTKDKTVQKEKTKKEVKQVSPKIEKIAKEEIKEEKAPTKSVEKDEPSL